MKASIIALTLLVAAAASQPVTKSEETPASKRTTILSEVESIPDSESEASENKEKRGAARLTPVSSNALSSERPGQSNQHQQLAEIAQLTQIQPQSPSQQLFAPHPYSFVVPYHQPKVSYNSAKSPFFLPQQQQQILPLPSFGPQQHQQYMLILPPQQSPAQHQYLMLIAPSPTATGFHYIAQPPSPHTGIPPQHLINFFAGQPQHHQSQIQQQPSQIQQREQSVYQSIPQQSPSYQQIHLPSHPQPLQQSTRIIYPQEQPHITYQTIPQEQQQSILSSQSLIQKLPQQQHQQQQIQQQQIQQQQIQQQQIQQQQIQQQQIQQQQIQQQQQQQQIQQQHQQQHQQQQHQQQIQQQQQQQQQQQFILEESVPTPAALVSSYGSRLHSQPAHHSQQQYKTIIKV